MDEIKTIHLSLITKLEDSGMVITSDVHSFTLNALIEAKSLGN